LRATMTLRHGVRRSSRVPTYTPTTPGMASSSLSCAASTTLMSRFGEGELPWAIFCRQAKKRASKKTTKQTPNRRQKIRQDCIFRKLHCKKCAHACRRMFRDLRFASAILLSHHAGAKEAEHLANRIRERINTVARKEQTNCARICGHVLNQQRSRITASHKFHPGVCDKNLAVGFVDGVSFPPSWRRGS